LWQVWLKPMGSPASIPKPHESELPHTGTSLWAKARNNEKEPRTGDGFHPCDVSIPITTNQGIQHAADLVSMQLACICQLSNHNLQQVGITSH
jgi:hypothetical protein